MKRGWFLRGLVKGVAVIVPIILYLMLYLFPAVVEINRNKRECGDVRRRVKALETTSRTLTPADVREKALWSKNRNRFLEKMVPDTVGAGGDALGASLCEWILPRAAGKRVEAFFLIREGTNHPACEKQGGGDLSRLAEIPLPGYGPPTPDSPGDGLDAFPVYREHLKPVSVRLAAAGRVRDVLGLLSDLSEFAFHLEVHAVRAFSAEPLSRILVVLRAYARRPDWKGEIARVSDAADPFVDESSPLLLRPVVPPPIVADQPAGLGWGPDLLRGSKGRR